MRLSGPHGYVSNTTNNGGGWILGVIAAMNLVTFARDYLI